MNGIIPLYKPKGLTSHDCVHKIRKILHIKKVGHTGTLDPDVEGVLPICVGEATKIIPFLLTLPKEYKTEVALGRTTTTEDAAGEVLEEMPVGASFPTQKQVEQVLHDHQGDITQIPPMYSAVKVKGKKLYEYAREGIEVERPKRTITIHKASLIQEKTRLAEGKFQCRILCSKGTYIRTLCVTIGAALGYPAHMSQLTRTISDGINLSETYTLEEITEKKQQNSLSDVFLPVSQGLQHLPTLQVDEAKKRKVLQGQKLAYSQDDNVKTTPFKIMHEEELLAVYEIHPTESGLVKPVRVFNLYKNEGE